MKNIKNTLLVLLIVFSFGLKTLGGITIETFRKSTENLIISNTKRIRVINTEISQIRYQIEEFKKEIRDLIEKTRRLLYSPDARIYIDIDEKKQEVSNLINDIERLQIGMRLVKKRIFELRAIFKEEQKKFNEREKLRRKLKTKDDFIKLGIDRDIVSSVLDTHGFPELFGIAFDMMEVSSDRVSDSDDDPGSDYDSSSNYGSDYGSYYGSSNYSE